MSETSQVRTTSPPPRGAPLEASYHILAPSVREDDRTHVLKHGDTFAVLDHFGDIKPGGLGEEGLYHEGTRFLSLLILQLEGGRPMFLSSSVRDENDQLTVALTNPDLLRGDQLAVVRGTLQLSLRKFIWRDTWYQRLRVENHGLEPVRARLALHFGADYADMFEVRGAVRAARGESLAPDVGAERVTLGYRGLDDVTRRTQLDFTPAPGMLTGQVATYDVELEPRQPQAFELVVSCLTEPRAAAPAPLDRARIETEAEMQRANAWCCHLRSNRRHFNRWIDRAVSDLHMMTTELETGPYPYAGVPWFSTPFGRDGILTALESLWTRPGLARGVLAYLAEHQATGWSAEQDAEPGKILHEVRAGEMAALKEVPFGRYYGSVDSTPLFVMLAGAYYERTADLAFLESLWPNVEAALDWIDTSGDPDHDGFVEYQRRAPTGLKHQGWKDSEDAISHADGTLAEGPIALCEVQGYVYAARNAGAKLASALGREPRAAALREEAEALREKFEEAFWCEELSTYALALDGEKRPCRVRASNAGQCLFTGIPSAERAVRVIRTLTSAEFFSGWGVRTLATTERRYNPMGYHNGTVWPHDNALIARGMARFGANEAALDVLSGLFEASLHFDLQRMPELFCGFTRNPGEPPVEYPVACSPQAWAAASVLSLLQTCIGLRIDAPRAEIRFTRPHLPGSVDELRIHNLEVAGASVDLALIRHDGDVSVNVLRREGRVEIVSVK